MHQQAYEYYAIDADVLEGQEFCLRQAKCGLSHYRVIDDGYL